MDNARGSNGSFKSAKVGPVGPDDPEPGFSCENPLHYIADLHPPSSILQDSLIQKAMALSTLMPFKAPSTFTAQQIPPPQLLRSSLLRQPVFLKSNSIPKFSRMLPVSGAPSLEAAVTEAVSLIQSSPATWKSALFSNLLIFIAGSPILVAGLSISGIGAAFLLGTLTWRAFGPSGFLVVASYFVLVRPIYRITSVRQRHSN